MQDSLLGIPNLDIYLVIGILLFFILIETLNGFWSSSKRTFNDWIQEAGSYFMLAILIKPSIVLLTVYIGSITLENYSLALAQNTLLVSTLIYVLGDDLLQYWYHRSAHEYSFLWKLHRPHHQAEEMGFFVSYRNAGLYYILMPNIWWIGIFTFLGGAKAIAIGLVLKQLIIISSHSTLHYDKLFYKYKWLNPVAWIYEHIFVTPAFHHAHHGISKRDGISDPNGNFGNMFSIWDQLFGTAHFSRQFPKEYGLDNDPKEPWYESYFFPFIKSKNPKSELSKGYEKKNTTTQWPTEVNLEKDKIYLFCKCGMSLKQPFCDGTHHGSKFKPQSFKVKKSGKVKLCNCKKTKTSPFCDNSHEQ